MHKVCRFFLLGGGGKSEGEIKNFEMGGGLDGRDYPIPSIFDSPDDKHYVNCIYFSKSFIDTKYKYVNITSYIIVIV